MECTLTIIDPIPQNPIPERPPGEVYNEDIYKCSLALFISFPFLSLADFLSSHFFPTHLPTYKPNTTAAAKASKIPEIDVVIVLDAKEEEVRGIE